MEKIRVSKVKPEAIMPTYGTAGAAGADLYACISDNITILPGQTVFVPTGLSMEIPQGYVGLIYARSGLACKRDLAPANKVGVIDSDYRGEFIVALHNHGTAPQTICYGERIAQLVIAPVFTPGFEEVDELTETMRGNNGFGSTGK